MASETPPGPVVDISADNLRVIVRGHLADDNLEDSAAAIRKQLRDLGVCPEAQRVDVRALLEQWRADGDERVTQILYEGTPPGPPTDGRLEWARDFFVTGFEVDPDRDTVDYRRRLDERSVNQDELLCTITEAIDGTPGIDVFGKPVPGPRAKRPRIRLGPNVTTPDGNQHFATCAGRIRWHGGVLSVDDVYVVEGSVNLRTGNIRHPGTLVIYRDIERDSVVVAEKDVDVFGMIDGGTVQAGGDVHVHGGIVGHGTSTVEAGGSIRAAYILDARVTAGGDVHVGREIVQSRVAAQGAIHVSQGRIVGGIVSAGTEIITGELGTEAAVKTAIHISEPQAIAETRRALEGKLAEARRQHEQVHQVITNLEGNASLSKEKREALAKLRDKLEPLKILEEDCQRELDAFLEQLPEENAHRVRVLRRLHSESVINIDGVTKKVGHAIDGPVTVRERGDEIRIFAD